MKMEAIEDTEAIVADVLSGIVDKVCRKMYAKEWREKNKNKVLARKKEYYEKNKNKVLEKQREYNSKIENKIRRNEYRKVRRLNDTQFKTANNCYRRLNHSLKSQNVKKSEHTFDLIGCSIKQLQRWLDFCKPYYVSDNYEGVLHIDHMKPFNSFDLNDVEQRLRACHFSNLRYLTAKANMEKKDKLPTPIDRFKMIVLRIMFEKKKHDY